MTFFETFESSYVVVSDKYLVQRNYYLVQSLLLLFAIYHNCLSEEVTIFDSCHSFIRCYVVMRLLINAHFAYF
jgi:hypothetical protein